MLPMWMGEPVVSLQGARTRTLLARAWLVHPRALVVLPHVLRSTGVLAAVQKVHRGVDDMRLQAPCG